MDSRKLCPAGWHVPSDNEWTTLERAVCSSSTCNTDFPYDDPNYGLRGTDEGGKLKEAGITHWNSPNTGATNSSGFTALPGGSRNSIGEYDFIGSRGYWWSTTERYAAHVWNPALFYDNSAVARYDYDPDVGFSVRCLKSTEKP